MTSALLIRALWAESRSFSHLAGSVVFSLGLIVTLQFGIPPDAGSRELLGSTVLWAAVLLTVTLDVRSGSTADRNDGFLDLVRVHRAATGWFAARLASVTVRTATVLIPLSIATDFAFTSRIGVGTIWAWGITVVGAIGLAAWTIVLTEVTVGSKSSDLLVGLLMFPLIVPQSIAAIRLGSHFTEATKLVDTTTPLILAGTFDLIAVGVSLMLFEYAVSE